MVNKERRKKLAFPSPPLDEGRIWITLVSISGFFGSGAFQCQFLIILRPPPLVLRKQIKNWRFLQSRIWKQRVAENEQGSTDKNQKLSKEEKALGGFYYWISFQKKPALMNWKEWILRRQNFQTNATLCFADFVNFTQFSSQISSRGIGLQNWSLFFPEFCLTWSHQMVWKNKTIGDAIHECLWGNWRKLA